MKIPINIQGEVNGTVGYNESENKESFRIGTQVAFATAEKFYAAIIKQLTDQLNHYKEANESTRRDMQTIVQIFHKYRIGD